MNDSPEELYQSLARAAQTLADTHCLVDGPAKPVPAWAELSKAYKWLRAARLASAEIPLEEMKAAEWLLDNDYQVHRALRQVGKDLPRSFYEKLPALGGERCDDAPRVFAMAHDLLRVTRMQISLGSAVRYVRAYQERQPLTIAELWAFPTMLRIACLEDLIAALTPLLGDRVKLPFRLSPWAMQSHSLDAGERVARAIANLGIIAAIPWQDFFDATSLVEDILANDPSGYYSRMDFASRDAYRRAIEELGRLSGRPEPDVATHIVELAGTAAEQDVSHHVGYWLVGEGRARLEQRLPIRLSADLRIRRHVLAHPGVYYALALAACVAGALFLPAAYLALVGATWFEWVIGLAAVFIPATALAITVFHWAITRILPPRVLYKLDFRAKLPADSGTIIVVPVIVAKADEIALLAEQIETHWLANSDPNLQVALLVDLPDAPTETMPGDVTIEDRLAREIEQLNERHGKSHKQPFHGLLRPRLHNPAQGVWMGWERKRGKLEQFNRMLVEGVDSAFSLHVGDRKALADLRFVITVDADTMLPPGSVAKLVGTLAHPLNQPRFDAATQRIVSGYSIIQPRVEISPQSGTRTLFARLFTGDTAIDIYSRAVSEVYQDMFGAGIFVGKGIYDLQAFHRSVDGCVPENRILSHDLFEGAYGRVALATDIVLYEGFPGTYLEYARRLHRWTRGDWQLLAWLRRAVPTACGTLLRNPITGIDRWKIVDNLRRSLLPPALMLLALVGWFLLPGNPWFWTLLMAFARAGQLVTDLISGLARGRRRGAARDIVSRLSDQAGRGLLAIIYLLHETVLLLHAIAITLWRLLVSRRNLLEWTTAALVAKDHTGRQTRGDIWRQMWVAPVFALGLTAALALIRPSALPAALPFLLLWMTAPEVTYRIDTPRKLDARPLDAGDTRFLRLLARRTWLYFETFAGPQDNWLAPDNYQAPPNEEIAHRTSPTNIGMLLLSTAAAWDLGYIGRSELAARTRNIFASLERLDRYRGHFYNWCDTRNLMSLEPRYVSTVDSGNLAVSLIAYAETLREAEATMSFEAQRWDGLTDVLALLDAAVSDLDEDATRIRSRLFHMQTRLDALRNEPDGRLSGLAELLRTDIPAIENQVVQLAAAPASVSSDALGTVHAWIDRLAYQLRAMLGDLETAPALSPELSELADVAASLAYEMDFGPLYNEERGLFFIGHNVSTGRTDQHFYDLLASEARLASFFAIAKGDVPLDHWFHLGRPVTRGGGGLSLISWNGSMFEYLMPRLLLRSGPETLLGESERTAVAIQRDYGDNNRVPWGISESAYASRDPEHRYRYQAFGVPGIGLRRGLTRDMVVAPYASALALGVIPAEAAANLMRLADMGAIGRYGLIEALDFTQERRETSDFMPVKAYMAHHQGMILAAIDNALGGDVLVRRFARDRRMNLVSLLLSERLPRELPSEIDRLEELERSEAPPRSVEKIRAWQPVPAPFPQLHLLGNGRLSSWISDAGGGGLRWRGNALTRFVPDATRDADGVWIYIADEETGALWSATRQPTGAVADEYHVTFHGHAAEFHRRDHHIETRLEVGVTAGDDIEVRRLSIANESDRPRKLRLTSYGEVVLAPPLDDERHPAFSKLFVCSKYIPRLGALLFTRRARSPVETPPVLLHLVIDADGPIGSLRYETDRRAFIGRGGSLKRPIGARSNPGDTIGCTLDPVMAMQVSLDLKAYERRELCFVTIAAASPEAAIEIAERYATLPAMDWALHDAAGDIARDIRQTSIDDDLMPVVQTLGSLLVYPHEALRAAVAAMPHQGQPSLWGMALSGDLPILVVRCGDVDSTLLKQVLGAHHYWRRQGLESDLVILAGGGSAYIEPMREAVAGVLREIGESDTLGRNGGVHLIFADQIGRDQAKLLEDVAAVVLDEGGGTLAEQVREAWKMPQPLPHFVPSRSPIDEHDSRLERPADLLFDNGLGGFTPDGREYVIHLEPGETTPAPWSNILANDRFGTLVTESGGGFSWAINSGENRLTPWTNDPVVDRPVETVYLRDEETAQIWTVTPSPGGGETACQVRHGVGYSEWSRLSHGLAQEMLVFVPVDAPVKIFRLRFRNLGERHRRLTATCYVEWLLGSLPGLSRSHVRCDYDAPNHVILAENTWNPDFADGAAFLTADRPPHSLTTDRQEFLGREADPAHPAGLGRWGLAGRHDKRTDSCGAYQVHVDLAAGASEDIVFVLGQGIDKEEALALARSWREPARATPALETLRDSWNGILGAVEVKTPDPAFDLMINRWLIHQTLASRVLARAGFYQASGAIGFRDQLQDVLALVYSDPARTRAHILECAAHQFEEGDVLHWWHPPAGRGVRTRFSDDLLWLPYAVGTYVAATGDQTILDEEMPFLQAAPLAAEEDDRYARFEPGSESRPLIDHCERALERVLALMGAHGLPLMGSGDWNDGMDRVGREGRGESVWLAWFASVTAGLVADLNRRLDRPESVERWRKRSNELRQGAEDAGWDGEWYRRAYDDDGQPWGSTANLECRIDSISQSWAAFAGADPARVAQALRSAQAMLIDQDNQLSRLLIPPFDHTPRDPGYIKSYPPGIRENGGQYSHAAAWLGLAFAKTGQPRAAYEIFGMLNPVNRAIDRDQADHYRGEPYVLAGDISAGEPHAGRSGWTWYTGSAAWTWRLGVEGLLGLQLSDGALCINPCIPPDWHGYEAVLRRGKSSIAVRVEDPGGLGHGRVELTVDGNAFAGSHIAFPADGEQVDVVAKLVPDDAT